VGALCACGARGSVRVRAQCVRARCAVRSVVGSVVVVECRAIRACGACASGLPSTSDTLPVGPEAMSLEESAQGRPRARSARVPLPAAKQLRVRSGAGRRQPGLGAFRQRCKSNATPGRTEGAGARYQEEEAVEAPS